MRIGGLEEFSLSDFPGRVAAVVFTQGCNFRCPFCHNGTLIAAEPRRDLIPERRVVAFLGSRVGLLDAVVVSGGEPTLQADLPEFLRAVRALGLATKLDTNGSRPCMLRRLCLDGLVDYIAMDIKAPLESYERLAGVAVDTAALRESIEIIARSGLTHEFRTTLVEPLLSDADLRSIKALLPSGSAHRVQKFRPEQALDSGLRQPKAAAGNRMPICRARSDKDERGSADVFTMPSPAE